MWFDFCKVHFRNLHYFLADVVQWCDGLTCVIRVYICLFSQKKAFRLELIYMYNYFMTYFQGQIYLSLVYDIHGL